MKRYACIFILIATAFALHAESVWTGNAAVGGKTEFPGESDSYRAASNSFPPGTVLQVTNPRGGRSVSVTVIGRLESPGVFILIEQKAAENIGLPLDHVMPVRVTPHSEDSVGDTGVVTIHSGSETDDTDFNPAASISEADEVPRTAVAPEQETEETPAEDLPESDVPDESPAELAAIVPEIDEVVEETVPDPEPVPADQSGVDPETIITYDLSPEDGDIALPEDAGDAGDATDNSDTVFFLMPSDPRPPEASPAEDAMESTETVMDAAPASEAVSEATVSTPVALGNAATGDGSRYIQIGAYRSRSILEDTANRLAAHSPGYPFSVAEESRGSDTVYKLLIGPLRPAEVGIVLQTARTTAFPDAFPYEP